MTNHLNNVAFQDEAKAREWLEKALWPHGPCCPFCGVLGNRNTDSYAPRPLAM